MGSIQSESEKMAQQLNVLREHFKKQAAVPPLSVASRKSSPEKKSVSKASVGKIASDLL